MKITAELIAELLKHGFEIKYHAGSINGQTIHRFEYLFPTSETKIFQARAEDFETFPQEVEIWIRNNLNVDLVTPSVWKLTENAGR